MYVAFMLVFYQYEKIVSDSDCGIKLNLLATFSVCLHVEITIFSIKIFTITTYSSPFER